MTSEDPMWPNIYMLAETIQRCLWEHRLGVRSGAMPCFPPLWQPLRQYLRGLFKGAGKRNPDPEPPGSRANSSGTELSVPAVPPGQKEQGAAGDVDEKR